MRLEELNALTDDEVIYKLLQCCGSSKWARAMTAGRPFATIHDVYAAADNISRDLERPDWLEAFRAHPPIGESDGSRTREWSRVEQAGALAAGDDVRRRLAARNRDYAARFGYIFIICATGKTAGEMLAALEERLGHDAARELQVAAAEQQKITRLRLAKLLETG
jgi:OHCU decarboxylase